MDNFYAFYPDPRPAFVNYNRTFDSFPSTDSSVTFEMSDLCNKYGYDSSALAHQSPVPSETEKDFTFHKNMEDFINDCISTRSQSNRSLQRTQKDGFSPSIDSTEDEKERFEDITYKSETSQQESEISEEELKTNKSHEERSSKNQQMDYEDQAKPHWSEEKDKLLLSISARFEYDWKKIAKQFGHKKITATFIKTRYHKLIDSQQQSRVKFHPMEDIMLAKYFEKYGFNWTKIAQHIPNRTPSMLKNRYYSFIRKNELLENLLQKAREIDQNQPSINKKENEELKRHMGFSRQNRVADMSLSTLSQNSMSAFSPKEIQEPEKAQNNTRREGLMDLRKEVDYLKLLFFQTKAELDELRASFGENNCN